MAIDGCVAIETTGVGCGDCGGCATRDAALSDCAVGEVADCIAINALERVGLY
jgi:hypothetical protein